MIALHKIKCCKTLNLTREGFTSSSFLVGVSVVTAFNSSFTMHFSNKGRLQGITVRVK